MLEVAAHALMVALYAGFVFCILRVIYFQTRIILQMFRVFYDSFQLLPWRGYANRAITRENALILKATAPFQSNFRGLIRAAKMGVLVFAAFLSVTMLFHLVLPETEFWLLHL